MRLIVVGINTDVGKTCVSAILTEMLNGYYWKPIQCGLPLDRERVTQKKNFFPEAFCLKTGCSPHLAAKLEGITINANAITLPKCHRPLIIEGAGGVLSPISSTHCWVDIALDWDASWIVVHRPYLGSLNHFYLTIEAIKQRKLPLLGVVFNETNDFETEEMLLKKTGTRCVGRLSWQPEWNLKTVKKIANEWSGTLFPQVQRLPFPL